MLWSIECLSLLGEVCHKYRGPDKMFLRKYTIVIVQISHSKKMQCGKQLKVTVCDMQITM